MQLIPQARRAYKLASVQVLTVATALWSVWIALPPEQQGAIVAALGIDWNRWGPLIALVSALIARLVAQPAVVPSSAEPSAGKETA